MQRAPASAVSTTRCRRTRGGWRRRPSPCSAISASTTLASRGRRRRARAAAPGRCERARARTPARAPARASRGCGARRRRSTVALGRARARLGRPGVLAREHGRLARIPSSTSRRACSREKQKARWGIRAQRRCTAPADRAARRGRGTPPSRHATRPRASRRRGGSGRAGRVSRGGEQREVRERGGVHGVVAAAVAQQVAAARRRRTPAAAGSGGARSPRVERHPRADGARPAHPGTPGSTPRSHWRSVR